MTIEQRVAKLETVTSIYRSRARPGLRGAPIRLRAFNRRVPLQSEQQPLAHVSNSLDV